MSNKFGNLRCSCCGSKNLEISLGYDGCDWKGKESGFMYDLSLFCNDCGRVYPVGRLKSESDFCENK